MLQWIRKLVTPRAAAAPTETEDGIAQASSPEDLESRLLRWEQRASEYGLRLP